MTKEELQQTSFPWKQIAADWNRYFTIPSRPSPEEVDQYSRWVKSLVHGKGDQRGLVLGATPELRDILFTCNVEVHAMDMNMEMLLGMTELLKYKNPDEVIIKSNWLANPLASDHFDFVLGDAVFPNIPWDARNTLFNEVVRVLKPGGHFINRAFFIPEEKPYKDLEQVLESYASRESSYRTATELVLDLQMLTYDPADHLGSMKKVKKVLQPLRTSDGFQVSSSSLRGTLNIVWNDWLQSASEKVWVYFYEHEEEDEYRRHFKSMKRFLAQDHAQVVATPMYLLQV